MKARLLFIAAVAWLVLAVALLLSGAGSAFNLNPGQVLAREGQLLTTTPPPPPPSKTPVDKAYAPVVLDLFSTPTATTSPDATPTIWVTSTFPSP